MVIDNDFILPRDLLKLEVDTLIHLSKNVVKIPGWTNIYGDICQARNSLEACMNRTAPWIAVFDTKCEITTMVNDNRTFDEYHVFFGTKITVLENNHYNSVSYYLAVCQMHNERLRLLRKYHFDYAPSNHPKKEAHHPVFHLQYAGKPTDKMLTEGVKCIRTTHPGLSIPRIPCSPMSLCLLVNLIFNEFKNNDLNKASGESSWEKLLLKNEMKLVRPYFKNVTENVIGNNTFSNYLFGNN